MPKTQKNKSNLFPSLLNGTVKAASMTCRYFSKKAVISASCIFTYAFTSHFSWLFSHFVVLTLSSSSYCSSFNILLEYIILRKFYFQSLNFNESKTDRKKTGEFVTMWEKQDMPSKSNELSYTDFNEWFFLPPFSIFPHPRLKLTTNNL